MNTAEQWIDKSIKMVALPDFLKAAHSAKNRYLVVPELMLF
jgi:hypothetical protein